tara:strand:- start:1347 stop:1511 length:165 start_codon:yes stop_codon:yes gene_type:complete
MQAECNETLSGLHVFDTETWACRCGHRADVEDLVRIGQQNKLVMLANSIKRKSA